MRETDLGSTEKQYMSLTENIAANGPMDERKAMDLARALCSRMLDESGITEADLTAFHPDTILLSPEGTISFSGDTVPESAKEAYLPPEYVKGATSKESIVIYGLGILLLFLVTGQEKKTMMDAGVKNRTLRSIINRCTALDSRRRFQTLLDVRSALNRELTFPRKRMRRLALSAALCLICAACVYMYLSGRTIGEAEGETSASMVLIIVSVYGTLLFGIYDANLMKPLTKEEAKDFLNRVELFKTNRMGSIIFHYVIPRMLCVAAIDYIGISISKRNNEMINTEIALSNKVAEGIIAKSNMQNAVIEHLADIIESRDIETGEHIKRTKQYVSILVNKMKNEEKYRKELDPLMCEYIINSAPLHDIGKIAVSDLILCKPGKLTEEEFNKMKTHTTKGGEIIENILHDLGNEDFLRVAFDIATSHHEKWNGDGYPYGKKGEEIPLPGRIMAIADVFDALVSKRIYKSPMPMDEAIQVIIHDAGTHFDPDIVEVFKKVKEEFIESAKMDI